MKDKKQHKTASCSAPSATRGLGAGRSRLLTALARHGFRRIFLPPVAQERDESGLPVPQKSPEKNVCFYGEELPQKPQ